VAVAAAGGSGAPVPDRQLPHRRKQAGRQGLLVAAPQERQAAARGRKPPGADRQHVEGAAGGATPLTAAARARHSFVFSFGFAFSTVSRLFLALGADFSGGLNLNDARNRSTAALRLAGFTPNATTM